MHGKKASGNDKFKPVMAKGAKAPKPRKQSASPKKK